MSSPDPSRIVAVVCAYWQTATLMAAIDLRVFSALGSRARTTAQLAKACRADRASLIRLCDALVSLGLLRSLGGLYRAAADAARFLAAESPESLVAIRRFFSAPPVTTAFAGLAATVRGGPKVRARVADPIWPAFAASTLALRSRAAKEIAEALVGRGLHGGRVLDVGAGASPLGIELLRRWRTATLVARDRAAVVRVARQHAIAAGVSSRVTTVAGDVMSGAWGGPFDLVLMVNVLDYFDGPAQARLLRKARRALRPGGALVIAAPLLDAGRRRQPEAAAYDLLLLALGSPSRPSTWQERRQQLRRAGFGTVTRNLDAAMVLARTRLR